MWGEMARIIHEVQPRFVFVENSPMLTSRGLGRVLGDLASMGFDARWGVLGAADIGANHQRDRIWIVAKRRGHVPYAQHNRIRRWEQQQESVKKENGAMAYSKKLQCNGCNNNPRISVEREKKSEFRNDCWKKELANSTSKRQSGSGQFIEWCDSAPDKERKANITESIGFSHQWSVEPNVGRVADGVAARVDRLKAIGNGQVPIVAATAFRILRGR
jgi:DNA (cytosine-5)-methyltransferase 1